MTEQTTPTGRGWLTGDLEGSAAWGSSPSLVDRILAIEAEAAAQERERLRAAWWKGRTPTYLSGSVDDRVMALLAEPEP
jgi:hypothetical protein